MNPLRWEQFLEHLEQCGGCHGERRDSTKCEFSLECASAECLSRNELVKNSTELIGFSDNFDTVLGSIKSQIKRKFPHASGGCARSSVSRPCSSE